MQKSRGVPDVNAVCKEAEKYEGTKPARSERWQLLWATLRILDSFLRCRAMGGLWKTREGLFVFSKAVSSCLSGLCLRESKNRAGKLEWHNLSGKYTLEQCILSPVYHIYIVINVGTERRVYLCSSGCCTAPPTVGLDSEDFWICVSSQLDLVDCASGGIDLWPYHSPVVRSSPGQQGYTGKQSLGTRSGLK